MAVKFTRRHYVQLAAIIARMVAAADSDDTFSRSFVVDFASQLADTLSRDNPRFNRMRFLAACGIQPSQR